MKIAITGKGGVGKTTFAATLARLYADEGRSVLAADADPDANLGLALGFDEEAFCQRSDCRENTLHVNDNRLTGTGQNDILLLEEITCHRNTAAHSHFIGGTADAGNRDAFRSHFFCISNHFRIIRIFTDHLRK